MKLLGKGWFKQLENFFDCRADFYREIKEQDETGQSTQMFTRCEKYKNVRCAVGDKNRNQLVQNGIGAGPREASTALLMKGSHPDIKIGWRVILDRAKGVWYEVKEVTPSQSADVTEVVLERLS